jgi:hypothetical protein
MENSSRIRINLSTKEFEVEGSEQFVKEYADKIENLLSALTSSKPPTPTHSPEINSSSPIVTANMELPAAFGEYLHTFPSSITDVDRMLIAGFYIQSQSADNSFVTASANELLKEQGIKLANPADCVAKNKNAKKVFPLAKGKYRVSQTGITYIGNLNSKN